MCRCSCKGLKPETPKERKAHRKAWMAWKTEAIDELERKYLRAKTAGVKAGIRRKINRHKSAM